jgi:thymidylate synthase
MLFKEAIKDPRCKDIYLTKVYKVYNCDRYFPEIPNTFKEVEFDEKIYNENDINFSFHFYKKKPHQEYEYINLLRTILLNGKLSKDRTKIGTKRIFGHRMEFNLEKEFPLITIRKTFWKGIVEELLFFIKGKTDTKILEEKGVKIWKGNTTREFLDNRGLTHLNEGDMGKGYGYQWRKFNDSVDQLKQVIQDIKNNSTSRRLIVSAWNPKQLKECALPPCHILFQFFVQDGKLSCQLYQRSADVVLGVPFNIASYSLLTCIIAKCCDLKPGKFIHITGDTHIYNNHLKKLDKLICRKPYPFPKLTIEKDLSSVKDIEKLTFEDFKLTEYRHHKFMRFEMAV